MRDHHELLEAITGYQRAALLTAASRIGLFDALHDHPRTAEDLARELGLAGPVTLTSALDALVTTGLVACGDDGYVLATPLGHSLRTDGSLAAILDKEATFARLWLDLDVVLREDAPLLAPWRLRLGSDPATCRRFLEALDALADLVGPPIERLRELAPGRSVVDVGGGLGSYAKRIAAAGSRVTLVELPVVADWAVQRLGRAHPDVEVVRVDVVATGSCGIPVASQDAALVSHLLHDLSDEQAEVVLTAATEALRPGGTVVVNTIAGDSGPRDVGALFDVMMRVETGGRARRTAELEAMLADVGLVDVRRMAVPEPSTVLLATLP